jgi:hypothetical protein
MSTSFEFRVQVLSDLLQFQHREELESFLVEEDVMATLSACFAYSNAMVTDFTGFGTEQVNAVFDRLLEVYGVEDKGYILFDDVVNASTLYVWV